MTASVGIFLYQDVEVLDFAGPFEVFTTASRVHRRLFPARAELFKVFTIAQSEHRLVARGGLQIDAHFLSNNHPELEVLIIPGGIHAPQMESQALIDWIALTARTTRITASVCTGAFLLAEAGLLDGLEATTHWEDIPELQLTFPDVTVRQNRRWVDNGRIVTSAGITAGIEMSLHLVARLAGDDLAARTARQMEYDWKP